MAVRLQNQAARRREFCSICISINGRTEAFFLFLDAAVTANQLFFS